MPEQPPEIERKLVLGGWQLAGMIGLLSVVVLALLGVFGRSTAAELARGSTLSMRVSYPTRLRYKTMDSVEVAITNTASETIDQLTVEFDDSYLSAFSDVTFSPAEERPGVVELWQIAPGERRTIRVQLQAEHYWRHQGAIRATTSDGQSVHAAVGTLVFP